MKKLLVAAMLFGSAAAYADRSVDELYPRTCGVCHAAAVAGAPKTGDAAAWQPRVDAKGMDGLVQSVTNGLNAYLRVEGGWRFTERRFDVLYTGAPDLSGHTLPYPEGLG